MGAASLCFGRFELQPQERRLLADGVPLALGSRAFDVLACLASRPGQLVSKQALLDEVWAGLVVEEANLTVQVSTLRKLLGGDVIATIPGRGYRFVAPLRAGDAAAAPAAAGAPATVPTGPPLVGRDDDRARVEQALADGGCVTLTGVAGVGKTSLARAVAAGWPAGSVFLDLAPLGDGAHWLPSLAHAAERPLDDTGEAGLARALGARLLVVDNAEHLADATAHHVARLLAAGCGLRVLVTSQRPLGLRAERVLRLAPLALPEEGAADDPVAPAAAVALFVARVQALDHRFVLDAASRPRVHALCRALDGLPLALEMAAARVPTLGLRAVHDVLTAPGDGGERFELLSRGYRDAAARHQTLRAALDWSHALLGPQEQRLYRALGVFAGGFTLELAVAVAADEAHDRWRVIDDLATLAERSLVAVGPEDPPRYRLLETMRAHAQQQLAAAGDGAHFHRRHAEALLALFRGAFAEGVPVSQRAVAIAEHDNAREAIAWAAAHDAPLALALGTVVAIGATFSSWRAQAASWLEGLAGIVDDPAVPAAARAAWWGERARQQLINRQPGARDTAARAQALFAELGDDRGLFNATSALVRATVAPDAGLHAHCDAMQALIDRHPEWPPVQRLILAGTRAVACALLGDDEGALRERLAEVAFARAAGRPAAADAAETNVIATLLRLGRAGEAAERGAALLTRIGEQDTINAAYGWRYHVAALMALGRLADARGAMPRVMSVHRRCGLPAPRAPQALLLALEGRADAALRLAAHARARLQPDGRALEADAEAQLARAEALAREALDDAAATRAVREGAELEDDAADRLFSGA
jgi:predicted ATPase/DNA-binding winged helix-turn-helix (wHTH) protein